MFFKSLVELVKAAAVLCSLILLNDFLAISSVFLTQVSLSVITVPSNLISLTTTMSVSFTFNLVVNWLILLKLNIMLFVFFSFDHELQ